uniref:glutathione transferase n=1 Tax=Tetranychus cinnabarinus TaxID=93129 RepID=A0A089X205_TETCI|nr:GST m3 [Tetranychus cinnabarinus]
MAPVLGYWDFRGLVDPIRLLLAHTGVDYEYKVYKIGPPPEFSKDEFRSIKHEFGFDFPNLPYYIDGDFKLTQKMAILRYLGRKHGLSGSEEAELTRCDLAEQAAEDLAYYLYRSWFAGEEASRKDLSENLPVKLSEFDKFIGSGPFVLGAKVTYSDFLIYSTLDFLRVYDESFLENFDSLKNFLARIEALPNIGAFIKSDKFSRLPISRQFAWELKRISPEVAETPVSKSSE